MGKVLLLIRVVRGSIIEKMEFEERLEAGEGFCLNIFEMSIQAEGEAGVEALAENVPDGLRQVRP